jgi:hypothetical protein
MLSFWAGNRARTISNRLGADWCIALMSAVAWLARYVSAYGWGFSTPFWAAYFDQSRYLTSAHAFYYGRLVAPEHWYPLLYPLLAAPFVALNPTDPFVLLDDLLFAACIVAFVRVARRLGVGPLVAMAMGLLACLGQGRAAKAWLEPWTTTLSAVLIWWMIERTLAIALPSSRSEKRTPREMILLGMLAGALPLARPTDLLIAVICVAVAAAALIKRREWSWQHASLVAVGAMLMILPYLFLHLAIYGPHPTPYMLLSAEMGFVFSDLPWKTYILLVSARPWYPETKSVIEMMPWLALSAAGVLTMVLKRKTVRAALLVIVAVAVPYCLLFFAYTDLQPPGLWHFGNFHYFKWILPLAGIGLWAWLAAFRTPHGARVALMTIALILLPTCIKVLPRQITDSEPARMLRFKGGADRKPDDAYFAPVTIADSIGRMRNVIDFHQMPDAGGEREIAIKRLFAQHPLRDDPGEEHAYAANEAPYERYGVRLSLGVPCWAKASSCR